MRVRWRVLLTVFFGLCVCLLFVLFDDDDDDDYVAMMADTRMRVCARAFVCVCECVYYNANFLIECHKHFARSLRCRLRRVTHKWRRRRRPHPEKVARLTA